ncbi:MAG: DEAD/DEAH box helicase family protein [Planctomycetes bacterium]|nr:DEAD/DEAH box helicase family protein [Planctomycetota bacterium]
MSTATIDRLIVNSPYVEPKKYWKYEHETKLFDLIEGRRPAGYVVASKDSRSRDAAGVFIEIPLVNKIRPRVARWRKSGYPGVTSITRRLLEYWQDPENFGTRRFFFCQLEAIETLIWLIEAPESEKLGVDIPGDGGDFVRRCCKMATGSGKTIVMAMLIAWQTLNKVTYPQDARFSKNVLVVAPGLTVKSRLSVLGPSAKENYYEAFDIVPSALMEKLRQGKVLIHNWHALAWDSQEKLDEKMKRKGKNNARSLNTVDKRKRMEISLDAYSRQILCDMASAKNLIVINDEAHHAWRVSPESASKYNQNELKESTVWIGGLDRIHRSRNILGCFDFSATPFVPSGKNSSDESLFQWIVSDFGLNDAIESGLVKTPRIVVRDDSVPNAKTYKSRLYHIYDDPEVKDDLNRKAEPEEPLPDLVLNAYYLLGLDWLEYKRKWETEGRPVRPVMISVCNRIETSARVKHAFDNGNILINELCDKSRCLQIDSKTLEEAESKEEEQPDFDAENAEEDVGDAEAARPDSNKEKRKELIRRQVATVGREGMPGEKFQNIISVAMLSEGWDAKTVTHIMGLRAFSSQLLCEQVVGRGLRRSKYDVKKSTDPVSGEETELFDAEYVNIFGVPFSFLPHEGRGDANPPTTQPIEVGPDPQKIEFESTWPNIVRIENMLRQRLIIDMELVEELELDASIIAKIAEIAPMVDGETDFTNARLIELEKLAREFRTQRIVFETARNLFEQVGTNWKGNREYLIGQLACIADRFIRSDKIRIHPYAYNENDLLRRVAITLSMSKVLNHAFLFVRQINSEQIIPVFDSNRPLRSTGDMRTWLTGKPCGKTNKSHINFCVYDSTWESSDAFALDNSEHVDSWVKNDHLGFEILYIYRGVVRKYRPDFLIRLASGSMLVLETKGEESEQDRVKLGALSEWIEAVNSTGEFGVWHSAVARRPGEILDILKQLSKAK